LFPFNLPFTFLPPRPYGKFAAFSEKAHLLLNVELDGARPDHFVAGLDFMTSPFDFCISHTIVV